MMAPLVEADLPRKLRRRRETYAEHAEGGMSREIGEVILDVAQHQPVASAA